MHPKLFFLNNYFRIKFIKVWLTIGIRANQFWIKKHIFSFFDYCLILWTTKYIWCDAYEWWSNTHFQCFMISIIFAWFYESCKKKYMISNLNVWLWKSQEIVFLVCMFIYLFVWRWSYVCVCVCVCVYCSTYETSVDQLNGGSSPCLIIWQEFNNKRLMKFLPNSIKLLYVSILLF